MLSEDDVVLMVTNFLVNKKNWNWHLDKSKVAKLHEKWVDIRMVWWSKNWETFLIECKKQYKRKSTNKECWIHALWQIITRMDTSRIIKKGIKKWDINRAYKYWLWLHRESAKVALRRIPREISMILNLYIFACCDNWKVIQFTPSQFWEDYPDSRFL